MAELSVEKSKEIQTARLPGRPELKPHEGASLQDPPLRDEERLKIITDLLQASKDPEHKTTHAFSVEKYTVAVVDQRDDPSKEHMFEKTMGRYAVVIAFNTPVERWFGAGVSASGRMLNKDVMGDHPEKLPDLSKENIALTDRLLRRIAAASESRR